MSQFLSDIEIAQATHLQPIEVIAQKLDIPKASLEHYGNFKAKLDVFSDYFAKKHVQSSSKLVLVSALNPTPFGEGKTTISIGLADALASQNTRVALCLREPSLGPVFGIKGGAAGGGYAQVGPMEDINLHFTGDFHAIESANNLCAALLDNHVKQGNKLGIDPRRIVWKRCMDMNDRQLRHIVDGLGGCASGVPREDGFDICAASEVMAVLCLASDIADLKRRLGAMLVAYTYDNKPVYAKDIHAVGAMCALLRDALKPNLVQTLEGTPAFVHGGPFANIAHGANTVIATRTALKCADVVITEAGFGADLGAEKFIDIVCPQLQKNPDCVVLTATMRALKYHGGVAATDVSKPNIDAVKQGFEHLRIHIQNIRQTAGLPCVVALNAFANDDPHEIQLVSDLCQELGVCAVPTYVWAQGSQGGLELARAVTRALSEAPSKTPQLYDVTDSIQTKVEKIATKWYHARGVVWSDKSRKQLRELSALGLDTARVCIAKTQYSLSDDPHKLDCSNDYDLHVRELHVSAGAGFVVIMCGSVVTMPGLGKVPAAEAIDVLDDGTIVGIF